jgi:hypothetical protein
MKRSCAPRPYGLCVTLNFLGFGLQTLREEEGGSSRRSHAPECSSSSKSPTVFFERPPPFSLAKLPSPPFFGHLIFSLLQEEEEGNIRSWAPLYSFLLLLLLLVYSVHHRQRGGKKDFSATLSASKRLIIFFWFEMIVLVIVQPKRREGNPPARRGEEGSSLYRRTEMYIWVWIFFFQRGLLAFLLSQFGQGNLKKKIHFFFRLKPARDFGTIDSTCWYIYSTIS